MINQLTMKAAGTCSPGELLDRVTTAVARAFGDEPWEFRSVLVLPEREWLKRVAPEEWSKRFGVEQPSAVTGWYHAEVTAGPRVAS